MSPPEQSRLQQADALLSESPREAEQLLLSILLAKPGARARDGDGVDVRPGPTS